MLAALWGCTEAQGCSEGKHANLLTLLDVAQVWSWPYSPSLSGRDWDFFFHMPPPQVSLEHEFDRRQILTYKSFKLCRVLLENGKKSASKNQRQSRRSVKTKEKEKERCWRHWIRLWCQIVVSAVLKSMGDTWRNTWKPNISTSSDISLSAHRLFHVFV